MAPDTPEYRASDADRDRVATALRRAHEEGRLALDEFDQRVSTAYQARTYGELEQLLADLPTRGMSTEVAARETPSSTWMLGLLSSASRQGSWRVPQRFSVIAIWGGGYVDLRKASFGHPEVVLHCVAIMGGIRVIVPPDVHLDVRGTGVMGGFDRTTHESDAADRPRVIVTGFALWGGVEVRRKAAKKPKSGTDSEPE